MSKLKLCACGAVHPIGAVCPVVKERRNRRFDRYKSQTQRQLRSSGAWRKKSEQIRTAVDNMCQVCLDKNIWEYVGKTVSAHHIIPVKDDVELLLQNDNICVLCSYHHKQAEMLLERGDTEYAEYLRRLAKERIKETGV